VVGPFVKLAHRRNAEMSKVVAKFLEGFLCSASRYLGGRVVGPSRDGFFIFRLIFAKAKVISFETKNY
jgi:hypothetical protein